MNCREFQKQLDQAVESRLSIRDIDPSLTDHVAACPERDCRSAWGDFRLLAETIPLWRDAVPPVRLTEQVLRGVRRQRPALRAHWPVARSSRSPATLAGNGVAVLAVVAATLLVAVPLTFLGNRQSARFAQRDGSATSSHILAEVDGDHDSGAPRKRSYVAMAQSATELVTDTMVLVIPAGLSETAEDDPSHASKWMGEWEQRLEPLGRELSTAFDALLQAVPKSPMTST